MQLVKIIERLVDYCDDALVEQKVFVSSHKGKVIQRKSVQYVQPVPSLKRIEPIGKSQAPVVSASVKILRNYN